MKFLLVFCYNLRFWNLGAIMTTLDTEHWHLQINPKWVVQPKYNPTSTECHRCSGSGTIGGGFKDIDGARTCDNCYGVGSITHYPEVPEPPNIPEDFIQHMRTAYKSYFTNKQKETNENIQEPVVNNSTGDVHCSTKATTSPETNYYLYQYL
jgi:hypothetical protein